MLQLASVARSEEYSCLVERGGAVRDGTMALRHRFTPRVYLAIGARGHHVGVFRSHGTACLRCYLRAVYYRPLDTPHETIEVFSMMCLAHHILVYRKKLHLVYAKLRSVAVFVSIPMRSLIHFRIEWFMQQD